MSQVADSLIGPLTNVVRTGALGVLAYVGLVLVLRTSGKRTLSKLNAFDLVVTVALGSCLATVLLSNDTSLLQGMVAFSVLAAMQFCVAWVSVRSRRVSQIVKSSPALLYYHGEFLWEALRRERVTREELYAAARSSGLACFEHADAIILESDGKLSVLHGGAQELSSIDGSVRVQADAAS